MNGPELTRRVPLRTAARIGLSEGNRSVRYARHWLSTLGGQVFDCAAAVDIAIVANDKAVNADCVIRLWDFQVGFPGSGILASAVSGAASVIGHRDGPGIPLPADMPEKWCGMYGVILALAEAWRRRNGAKQKIVYDVSAADVVRVFSLQNSGGREEMVRTWRRNGHLCIDHGGIFPMGFYPCKDGYVALLGRSRRDWENLRQAIGNPSWAREEAYQDPFVLAGNSAQADELLEQTLAAFTRDELLHRGLNKSAVIAPVYTQTEAESRAVFRQQFIVDGVPEMPFQIDEHDTVKTVQARLRTSVTSADQPLTGLRCMELCWVWSGPMIGQILADLGADVIKVEAPRRFDLYRTRGLEHLSKKMDEKTRVESSLYFHSLNRNKSGLTLDLKHPKGLDVALRLASESDMLIENFTVGTMERLGLDGGALFKANPALVQMSMSGPGRGSSVETLRSYGLVLSALGGAEDLVRNGEEFIGSPTFSLSDPNAAAFGAMGVLAGVLATHGDGRGRIFDVSQIEAAATLAGTPMPEVETASAILMADDGGYVAVSFPISVYADGPALQRALAGASRAEIEALCRRHGGYWSDLLELEDTDGAPVFADGYGWVSSKHAVTGNEELVAAPWRANGQRPEVQKAAPILGDEDDNVLARVLSLPAQAIDSLKRSGAVGLAGYFD